MRSSRPRTGSTRRGLLAVACSTAIGAVLLAPAAAAAPPLPPVPPLPALSGVSRTLGAATALLAGSCADPALAAAMDRACEAAAEQVGIDAYQYGIPLLEFRRLWQAQTAVAAPDARGDAPVNQFGSVRGLATAHGQFIVAPNNDTPYSSARLDLGDGPLVLRVPDVGSRYYVLQFLDPYTNVFAYVGTRSTGNRAGTFLVAGPDYTGPTPAGMTLIRSPYRLAWIVGRTLSDGPADLPAVHRVQDGYRLSPLHGASPAPAIPPLAAGPLAEPTGLALFDRLGDALALCPPPAADRPVLAELRSAGIGPGLHPSAERLTDPVRRGLAAAADEGYRYVYGLRAIYTPLVAREHHGWVVPQADTGDFGTNYTWRAVVALFGIAANRPEEAVYPVASTDGDYRPLDGGHGYLIHFAPGLLPPARYFWSLTMYDDRFRLVDNPLDRYSLGNRTPDLHYNPDGSLDIYVQHTPPAGHESNWLPAPAARFEVTMRIYGPQPSVLDNTYPYPPITRTH